MTKTSTDAQIVGSVSFINGDAQQFTDAKEYLDCIRKELPHEATTGFRFRTITQDPAIRKAVDDIVYDFYGEENPCREEDYNLAPSVELECPKDWSQEIKELSSVQEGNWLSLLIGLAASSASRFALVSARA